MKKVGYHNRHSHKSDSGHILQNKPLLNSQKRLIDFKSEWKHLLDEKFTEKSTNFDKHYKDVLKTAITSSSDLFTPSCGTKPFEMSSWIKSHKQTPVKLLRSGNATHSEQVNNSTFNVQSENQNGHEVEKSFQSSKDGIQHADNKFIAKTLKIRINYNAPPLYMPQMASIIQQSHSKVNSSSYSMRKRSLGNRYTCYNPQSQFTSHAHLDLTSNNDTTTLNSHKHLTKRQLYASPDQQKPRTSNRPKTAVKRQVGRNLVHKQNKTPQQVSQAFSQQTLDRGDIYSNAYQVSSNGDNVYINDEGAAKRRPQSSNVYKQPQSTYINQSIHDNQISNLNVASHLSSAQKLKSEQVVTSIDVIDRYYQTINRQDEVDRIIFVNEFQRFYTQIERFWKQNQTLQYYEQPFVSRLITKEVHQQRNQDSSILLKLNQYLIQIERFINLENQLKNLMDERDSLLFKLKIFTQNNDLTLFEKQGVPMLLMLRTYTLQIVKYFKAYKSFVMEGREEIWEIMKSCGSSEECVMCRMLDTDVEELRNVSLIMMKLQLFVKDMIVFLPRLSQEVIKDIQKNTKRNFTVTEISTFERIMQQLRVPNIRQIETCFKFLLQHKCPNRFLIKIQGDIGLQSNDQSIISKNAKQIPIKQRQFLKFNWIFEQTIQEVQPVASRLNLKQRIQGAYEYLKDQATYDAQTLNQDDNFESITDIQNQASYRDDIHIFKQQDSSNYINTNQISIDHATITYEKNAASNVEIRYNGLIMNSNSSEVFKAALATEAKQVESQKFLEQRMQSIDERTEIVVYDENSNLINVKTQNLPFHIDSAKQIGSEFDSMHRQFRLASNSSSEFGLHSKHTTQPKLYSREEQKIYHQPSSQASSMNTQNVDNLANYPSNNGAINHTEFRNNKQLQSENNQFKHHSQDYTGIQQKFLASQNIIIGEYQVNIGDQYDINFIRGTFLMNSIPIKLTTTNMQKDNSDNDNLNTQTIIFEGSLRSVLNTLSDDQEVGFSNKEI